MKSEWKVLKNVMLGDEPFVAYRLYDKQKIMYDGNIEYDFLTFPDRKLAEKRAKELNRKN